MWPPKCEPDSTNLSPSPSTSPSCACARGAGTRRGRPGRCWQCGRQAAFEDHCKHREQNMPHVQLLLFAVICCGFAVVHLAAFHLHPSSPCAHAFDRNSARGCLMDNIDVYQRAQLFAKWRPCQYSRRGQARFAMSATKKATKGGESDRLDKQKQRNEDLHLKECNAMQANFDARLPKGLKQQVFAPSDFQTYAVKENLLGENLNTPFKEECDAVVKEAEAHAAAQGGWGTKRHYSHPTTDVLLSELPESCAWFQEALTTKVFPMVADRFPNVAKDPERLRIFDVFVVKYDSAKQSYLSVHRDSSLISLTIALNPRCEFEGGGMWVEPLDAVIELDQGQAVTFASNIRHGGHRITAGCRYILVGFLLYEGYVEHDRRLLEASQALRAEGKMEQAERLCRDAVEVNPRRQEAWNNLGVLQRDQHNLEAAMASFATCLEIEPSYQEGWINLGVCQSMAGLHEEAVATAKKAVALNEGDGTSHYNLGCALAESRNINGAMASLGTALKLNPSDGDALHRRGQLRVEMGACAAAIEDLEAAAALLPRTGAVYNDLGVALYEEERVEAALAAFEKAASLDSTDTQARDNAAALRAYLRS